MHYSTSCLIIFLHMVCVSVVLGVRGHLTEPEVARAIQMLEDGISQRDVAAAYEVIQSGASRIWTRLQRGSSSWPLHPAGGTSPSPGDCQMDFHQATGVRITNQTARNRLHDNDLYSSRPVRDTILLPQHRRNRLEFALNHQNWQLRHWGAMFFTNESRLHVSTCDRRVRVWRRSGDRYEDWNVLEYDRYGGGSVMVRAGICLDGRTDLHVVERGALTAARYRDEVQHPIVGPFVGAVGPEFILM